MIGLDYLSELIEMERAMKELKVDSVEHAAYIDRDERSGKLDVFAKQIAYSSLAEEERARLLRMINESKKNLSCNENEGSESFTIKNFTPYLLVALLSGAAGFGLGWKSKGEYEKMEDENIRKTAEKIAELVG